MLNFAAIVPHPPAIIPTSQGKNLSSVKKTLNALEELAEELKQFQPHTIVIISPHGPMRYDKFTINLEENFKGSFQNFGFVDNEKYNFRNDFALAQNFFEKLRKKDFPAEPIREENIDYGSLIPLHYLTKNLSKKPKIILLTYTSFDWNMHFTFGRYLKELIDETDYNIAFIASADLSHRISDNSPAGFSPYGIKFDQTLLDLLKKGQGEKILELNPEFCEEAAECGLRSIITALGVLNNQESSFVQLAYEHPLGVGYLTGRWKFRKK